jgi:hypothetical protein
VLEGAQPEDVRRCACTARNFSQRLFAQCGADTQRCARTKSDLILFYLK